MEIMHNIFIWCLFAMFVKAIIIGSQFNFYYCMKYKKEYTTWYFNQPTFKPKDK